MNFIADSYSVTILVYLILCALISVFFYSRGTYLKEHRNVSVSIIAPVVGVTFGGFLLSSFMVILNLAKLWQWP